jgi:hypothetical protein
MALGANPTHSILVDVPSSRIFSLSQVPSRRDRVVSTLAKLGIKAHIVVAHTKPSTKWDWAAVRRSKAFMPETLDTLTAGEVAVSLSQRKALHRYVCTSASHCY